MCKHHFFFFFLMQRFITCRFLDVANTMLEITDFCPKLRFFSILITDFNFQRLAALLMNYQIIVLFCECFWWPMRHTNVVAFCYCCFGIFIFDCRADDSSLDSMDIIFKDFFWKLKTSENSICQGNLLPLFWSVYYIFHIRSQVDILFRNTFLSDVWEFAWKSMY